MLRCVAREAGLPEVDCTRAYAEQCRRLLIDAEISPQRAFHSQTRVRSLTIHRRLAVLGEQLFFGALLFAVVHLLTGRYWEPSPGAEGLRVVVEALFAGACVALPAVAASVHGYLGLGDFAGIAMRSGGMEPRLAQVAMRLEMLEPVDVGAVGELGVEATTLMESELASWRTAADTREIEPP